MKTFTDLSELEKVELTAEQVKYYAKIDCANRGIIIPQKPINQLKDVVAPTQNYFQVGYESFVFDTMEDAQNYIDAKSKSFKIRSIGNNYDNKNQYISERTTDYKEIKTIVLYTKEESVELKTVLEYNAEVSKELKEYSESLSKYNEIESSIWDEIQEINYYNSRKKLYDKIYSDYLELASGNDEIAFTFFDKAYRNVSLSDIDREIVDAILTAPKCVEPLNTEENA